MLADDPPAPPEPPRPAGKADVRTAIEIRADAQLSDDDLDDAEDLWDEDADDDEEDDAGELPDAFPVNDRPGRPAEKPEEDDDGNPIVWWFLLWTRLFQRVSDGLKLSRPGVRVQVDAVLEAAQKRLRQLGERLQSGDLDLPSWQSEMEAEIKRLHGAQSLVAAGGRAQFDHGARQAAVSAIAFQFTRLQRFAHQIETGLALDGAFLARCEMYATSSAGTYERVLRVGDRSAGFTWERRVRHSSRSCQSCIDYEAEGWQPIGVLPAPGEACACRGNCLCTFERTRSHNMPSMTATDQHHHHDPLPETDPMTTLFAPNREKCDQRNRIAARKGFDAFPVRLYADRAPSIETSLGGIALPDGQRFADAKPFSSKGRLPKTQDEALAKINALRGDAEPMMADQVYITYAEAANSNYVSKYQFFLGLSTLKNIAAEADRGFAFMNSHRTGGVSEPTELPYGKTFAGRLETYTLADGTKWTRTLLGVYMVRGLKLNGANGPSTDDLYAAIKGGTLGDVSMGLAPGGEKICDVCGEGLEDRNEEDQLICPHVPGTNYAMTDDEIATQEARGVPGGVATYTLEEAHAREVSAVYAGAVPGAGFRKALSLSARLDPKSLGLARQAYITLSRDGDFADSHDPKQPQTGGGGRSPRPILQRGSLPMPRKVSAADVFNFWLAAGKPDEFDLAAVTAELAASDEPAPAPSQKPTPPPAPAQQPPAPPRSEVSPEMAAVQQEVELLRSTIQTEREQRERDNEANFTRSVKAEADVYALQQIREGRYAAAQRQELVNLYVQNAVDDRTNPIQGGMAYMDAGGNPKRGTRLDAFKAMNAKIAPTNFHRELVNGRDHADLSTIGTEQSPKDSPEYKMAAAWGAKRNTQRKTG